MSLTLNTQTQVLLVVPTHFQHYLVLGVLLLNLDECMEILAGACHLQMRSAISLCADFLETELCAKTCVDILNIAEMFAIVRVSETKHTV